MRCNLEGCPPKTKDAATATAMDTGLGDGSRTNEMWHVRHGKPGLKTLVLVDPSLTRCGHVQASSAGLYLKSLPFTERQQQPGTLNILYTSPLVRAVQTAVCVSNSLGDLPLQVVRGLCSCAAALKRLGYDNMEANPHDRRRYRRNLSRSTSYRRIRSRPRLLKGLRRGWLPRHVRKNILRVAMIGAHASWP